MVLGIGALHGGLLSMPSVYLRVSLFGACKEYTQSNANWIL